KQQADTTPLTKNQERRERFKKIGEALDSIYKEAAWRHRKEDHEFQMRPEVLASPDFTSRAAGGPAMKTLQYDCGVRGIHGMSQIADKLIELQKVEALP